MCIRDSFKTAPKELIEQADQKLKKAFSKHKLKFAIAIIGPILGLIAFILSPTTFTFVLLVINLVLFALFQRLANKKRVSWGKTYDVATKKPLPKTVIRLFDTRYNRLLLTDISKNDGRYGFLVGNDRYIITSEKDNYKLPQGKIEVSGDKTGVVSQDLGLDKI